MDLPTLYAQCAPNVAPQTLAAIVRVESGGNPWRIGINGNYTLPRQPQNKAEAVREANRLIGLGYNIDLGLMQINVKNLGSRCADIAELLPKVRKRHWPRANIAQTRHFGVPHRQFPQWFCQWQCGQDNRVKW
ncbi:MAG: hypothetical protein B7Y07_10745 [Halothiobacillus sp. 24-54-40]|nr:MAG: hypothetical protein B7Y07_10745 [Halothiobacillus sp. 24-54-40]